MPTPNIMQIILKGDMFSNYTKPDIVVCLDEAAPSAAMRYEASQSRKAITTQPRAVARPRVTFRNNNDNHVYPALSSAEYDRQPLCPDLRNVHEICKELCTYLEREMPVHAASKYTVIHAHLHGQPYRAQQEVRRRLPEINGHVKKLSSSRRWNAEYPRARAL